jgi:hypothetical protein
MLGPDIRRIASPRGTGHETTLDKVDKRDQSIRTETPNSVARGEVMRRGLSFVLGVALAATMTASAVAVDFGFSDTRTAPATAPW